MLALTETAAEAISNILETNEMPEGSGLRIAATPNMAEEGLELSVAPNPAGRHGARGRRCGHLPRAAGRVGARRQGARRREDPGERDRRLRRRVPLRHHPAVRAPGLIPAPAGRSR